MAKKYWIQKVGVKKGSLSRQLGIPIGHNIPETYLKRIIKSKAGKSIKLGSRRIKVTRKLEQRANLALTLKKLRRKR